MGDKGVKAPQAPTYVRQVEISGVERRSKPTKHYAYVLRVGWSNGKHTTAVRSHTEFFNFHCELLSMFPDEAGDRDKPRSLPTLPGKSAQSKTEMKASTYIEPVQGYCVGLLSLAPNISRHTYVLDFFRPTPADYAFEDLERTLGMQAKPSFDPNTYVDDHDDASGDDNHGHRHSSDPGRRGSGPTTFPYSQHGGHDRNPLGHSSSIDAAIKAANHIADATAIANSISGDEVDPSRANLLLVRNRLSYRTGEVLQVLRMTDCPGGHWWCRNRKGEEGHVPSSDLSVDLSAVEEQTKRLSVATSESTQPHTQQTATETKLTIV